MIHINLKFEIHFDLNLFSDNNFSEIYNDKLN